MNKAIAVSGAVSGAALWAMFLAPPGRADALGALFRTAVAVAFLALLGRVVGAAGHRRPPRPQVVKVLTLIVAAVAIEVLAIWLLPGGTSLAIWYVTLFVVGIALNRWGEAPDRYALLVGTFVVFLSSLILAALSAASVPSPQDFGANTVTIMAWRNVARVAASAGDAAWTWLAWRVADRLRAPEAKRKKLVPMRPMKSAPAKRRTFTTGH